ncbi:MAG: type II toxin-antitoxin system MqsA family antitoxin [Actinobacteria bacterium]|nr:MAG: type II toxin-antitoxin system MqsA family antitoxin [Actinomycetota bacterium]
MKCLVCKQDETKPGKVTVTLERGKTTLVVKEVPAQVCANCGEEYVDDETTQRLLKIAEEAAKSGVQVDVREYAAA